MATGLKIECIAWGHKREKVREHLDWRSGELLRVEFATERLFWWYDATLERHTRTVRDDEQEPQFLLLEGLPFRVTEADFDRIEVAAP